MFIGVFFKSWYAIAESAIGPAPQAVTENSKVEHKGVARKMFIGVASNLPCIAYAARQEAHSVVWPPMVSFPPG